MTYSYTRPYSHAEQMEAQRSYNDFTRRTVPSIRNRRSEGRRAREPTRPRVNPVVIRSRFLRSDPQVMSDAMEARRLYQQQLENLRRQYQEINPYGENFLGQIIG